MIKKVSPFLLLLFCVLPFIPQQTFAQTPSQLTQNNFRFEEEIDLFESDIVIHEDSSLTVTETITVYALNYEINHGIYRDFPTIYKDLILFRKEVGFNLISIKRDGRIEPYHTERISNGIRIYIGSEDHYVPVGLHTYELKYKTNRQLGYFVDHDELYYNITGNGWTFPINKVRSIIHLPSGVASSAVRIEGYTGKQGSRERSYQTYLEQPSTGQVIATIETTRKLEAEEGLTVVVTWPKEYVQRPSILSNISRFIWDNIILFLGTGIFFVILIYYFIAWILKGRDPKRGTIIPLFSPPKGLSPAVIRFIDKMGYDNKHMTAALVHAASQGAIKIEEKKGKFTMERSTENFTSLPSDEKAILDKLLPNGKDSFTFSQTHYAKVQTAIKGFKAEINNAANNKLVISNTKLLIPAIFINLVFIAIAAFYYIVFRPSGEAGFMFFWLSFWSIGTVMLIWKIFLPAWAEIKTKKYSLGSIATAIFISAFTLPFIIGEIAGFIVLGSNTGYLVVILLLGQLIQHMVFFYALKVRTPEGRSLEDRIEGFKMFIGATERERIKILHKEVPKTIREYEKYLPFAIALDMETKWMKQFKRQIDEIEQTTGENYSPSWFTGSSNYAGSSFGSSFGSGFSSSISSASTAPGSSSGSGGGSGGGGGGGGGGGW